MTDSHDEMINRYIGGGLSLARIVRGLSVAELAMAAGIEPKRLGRLERGEAECTARELFMVAEVLCVPVDYFFDGVTASGETPAAAVVVARPSVVSMVGA